MKVQVNASTFKQQSSLLGYERGKTGSSIIMVC